MQLIWRSLVVAVIFLAALGATPAPTPAQEDAPLKPGTWRLDVREAVTMALQQNLDLAVARLGPESQAQNIVVNEAAFDHYLESSLSHSEREEEPTSNFSVESSTADELSVRYVNPLMSGGQWSAEVSHGDFSREFPPGSEDFFNLIPDTYNSGLTLGFSHPLLRNYGLSINRTSIEQARNSLSITEAQLQDQVLEVVRQVESAYWSLVGAIKQREVAQTSLELAEDFLRQTKIKVDVGTLPPIEITTAEAELAARQEGMIVAENTVRDREDDLRALMRVPQASELWDTPIEPTDEPTFVKVEIDLDRAIGQAVERRAPIKQAELELRNAELTERYRRNQLKPDLRVQANYTSSGNSFEFVPNPDTMLLEREDGTRGDSFSEIVDLDNTNWTVGLSMTLPLGNRDARARHVQSRIALEEAALQLDQAEQTLRVEVRKAVRAVATARRRVDSARVNMELQERRMEAERKRYENGLSTSFQVLESQRDFLQARSDEIGAVIDYNQALVSLSRVTGTLLQERQIGFGDN